jgi:hypothetical protein
VKGNQTINHHSYLIGLIFILLVASCQRSQFATTARHNHKGKVSYSNSFHYEGRRASKGKPHKTQLKSESELVTATVSIKNDQRLELGQIMPVPEKSSEQLIASTSIEPMFAIVNKKSLSSYDKPVVPKNSVQGGMNGFSHPDTIIKKNDSKTVVNEIHSTKSKRIEILGLVSFILGILCLVAIPITLFLFYPAAIGLPIAILTLIFGIKSLHKIHKNPTLFKGKGFAITGIVLGFLSLAVFLLIIGLMLSLFISLG